MKVRFLLALLTSQAALMVASCGDASSPGQPSDASQDFNRPDGSSTEDAGVETPVADTGVDANGDAPPAPAPFTLSVAETFLARSGGSAVLPVRLTRLGDFKGPVTIEIRGLPVGAHVAPRTLTSDTDAAALVVGVDSALGPGTRIDASVTASAPEGTMSVPLTVLVAGAPFTLDPTFPVSPIAHGQDAGDAPIPIAQKGGKVVFVTQKQGIVFTRHDISGALDHSFGPSGSVTVNVPGGARVLAAKQAMDERILVASGTEGCFDLKDTPCSILVSRHLQSGALDLTFANIGYASTDFGKALSGSAHLVLSNGRGVALVATYVDALGPRVGAQRWDGAGAPIADFGTNGFTSFEAHLPEYSSTVFAAAETPRGSLVLPTVVRRAYNDESYYLLDISTTGSPYWQSASYFDGGFVRDATVGSGRAIALVSKADALSIRQRDLGTGFEISRPYGHVLETTAFDLGALALALDADGLALVTGRLRNSSTWGVARFKKDGTLDTAFGTSGVMSLPSGVDSLGIVTIEPLKTMLTYSSATKPYRWLRLWP